MKCSVASECRPVASFRVFQTLMTVWRITRKIIRTVVTITYAQL